jgi:hypothetical protein
MHCIGKLTETVLNLNWIWCYYNHHTDNHKIWILYEGHCKRKPSGRPNLKLKQTFPFPVNYLFLEYIYWRRQLNFHKYGLIYLIVIIIITECFTAANTCYDVTTYFYNLGKKLASEVEFLDNLQPILLKSTSAAAPHTSSIKLFYTHSVRLQLLK